ncbi:ribonuclease activity regulator RraA [Prosthecomicrobium sp. N25]|uniref:RraA family protein n=1 Tax=Prosthecomicrobium sp. N25 TaxID=3129254 RepID=UPI00307769B0
MTHTQNITRPPKHLVAALKEIGSATIASELYFLGIRNVAITGPRSYTPGRVSAGPALTLQFMPMREDMFGAAEYDDPEKQLHRHVLYHAEAGDMVLIDARGDMTSGIFGEMMMAYFAGVGGEGVVIDGCIRDSDKACSMGPGVWLRGTTPNFHAQTNIFPFAVNVPIACGGVFVMPGDIVVADNDGAVVVPVALAEKVVEEGRKHADWEVFSRLRLSEGGDMRKYYPLRADAEAEYLAWRAAQARG